MRRLVKAISRTVVVLLALLILVLLAGYAYLRQSLPTIDGAVTVSGLFADVDIVRDADGIPHIMATSKRDALFGLGYVHAQDRLWQMEFQRRIGHGRLAEIFGAAALPQDRFLRTVGFGRAARRAWEHLSAEARADTNAYVAGINAFIAGHHGRHLPPEFSLLRFEPEPWTGADVMAWIKMMAWDLGANYSLELLRRDLAAQVGEERAAQLMPPYPSDGPTIVDGPAAVPAHARGDRVLGTARDSRAGEPWSVRFAGAIASGHPGVAQFLLNSAITEAVGSNNWVVDGTRTASGKPLLANDPHLGATMPSLWYLAHMSAGAFDVIGATLPGAPAVAIGRNRHIAWGETNVAADVQDLYLEKLDPAGKAAEFKGEWEPLFVIRETIAVQGAAPVELDIRMSRHGPLVSDAINAMNAGDAEAPPIPPLALRWTALDDRDTTLESFLKLNEARNWDEFVAALQLFVTPSQNFVYADVDGHIGYFLPGRVPLRQAGDGARPVPGWTGDHEWTGFVPFEALPRLYDPPSHTIVTANQRPNPHGDPLHFSLEYPEPYRARQIRALLEARPKLTPDDFRQIQADTHSRAAEALLPLLLAAVQPTEARDRLAVDILRAWDFDAAGNSAAAAIFQAWFLHLAPAIVGDDLGPRLLAGYQGRYSFVTRFLTSVLTTGTHRGWCDNRTTTAASETCPDAITAALHSAVASLAARLGNDVRTWKWRDVHPAVFPHQGLDAVAALRPILNRSVPSRGDWSTINVGAVDAGRAYEQHEIPGYRQIVDLSPANDSRFLDAVGQSGHFLSPRYDDFLESFAAVQHRPMRMEPAAIGAGAIGTLRLRPPRRE